MPHTTCNNHDGQVKKLEGLESKIDEGFKNISDLFRYTITLLATLILGFITSWWAMNTTISTISGKQAVYDKIFDTKIEAKLNIKDK